MKALSQHEWEQFITVWNGSNSLQEAANILNRSKKEMSVRAHFLRKKGVPLKKMPKVKKVNYAVLSNLAMQTKETK